MKRLAVRGACLAGLATVLSCAPGQPAGRPAAPAGAAAVVARPAQRALPGAIATSVDESRGVPRFLWATGAQPAAAGATAEAAARAHLARHAAAYRATAAHVAGLELAAVHDSGRGGVIVTLRQRVHGIEVYRGDVKVLMRRDLGLVAISGSLVEPEAARTFARTPEEALAAALGARYGVSVPPAAVTRAGAAPGGYTRLDLTRPVPVAGGRLRLGQPARVKPVVWAERGPQRPAWFVEFFAGTGARAFADAWRFLVAADDGAVLERRDLTRDVDYRVWVDATGRPLDGPQADFTPHPTGHPDGSSPAFIAPSLVTQNGFNHNPAGGADPWLADGATESRGNNVDAYADLNAPDGFSAGDLRATTTAAGVFDRVYDTAAAPAASTDQIMAGITQAFYTTNWLHDWYYDSGFDEAAGNAQKDNYGRGGLANDPLLVQGQDYSGTDNSDMSVPSDGASPRMQAYIWTGADSRTLTVTPPGSSLATASADFGPGSFDLTGDLVLVNDGSGTVTDACQAITNDVSGKIALIDRGTCTFQTKALAAQAAGAIGAILANNQSGGPMQMPGDGSATVTIPVLSVSQTDGAALKTALTQAAVSAHMTRAAGVNRDGTLDNTVVAHEWGHYLHLRLAECNQGQCAAMSEGWGDFTAAHLVVREGDDLDGTYALAIYASAAMGDSGYFGIRRAPYSVDFTKNAMTFRHIMDGEPLPTTTPLRDSGVSNAEAHNAGEIWAEMLFEAYVALLKDAQGPSATRTFEQARRTMSDYVVAGLKLTPADATYTEARDALLAAATAANPADVALLAAAFARRGAGSCAVAPPRDSWDFQGVVESYDVKPQIVVGEPTLDASLHSCDGNTVLNAGEQATLSVPVTNGSPFAMAGTSVSVTSPTAGITFPAGTSATLGELTPYGSGTATFTVALDASVTTMQLARFSVTVTAADACSPQVQRDLAWRINFTDAPASCATDDVESETSQWVAEGDESTAVWARVESEPGNHVWRGIDLARPSDSWIMSPDLKVSATGSFGLSFRHRHEFETAQEDRGTVYYDGAVIELTSDGGTTWQDISTYADPGYGGTIDNTSGNPLADRRGYVDHNPSWPETDTVTLDLGSALAGKTVRVRFHIGTDQAAGGAGWELDDIGFTGIDNTPFTRLVDDAGACAVAGPEPPATDAGATGDGGPAPGGGSGRGCSCTTGATGGGGPALLALAALGVVLSARRRRRRWRSPSATSCPPRASAARGSAPSRPSSRACRPSPRRTAPRSSCPRPRP